MFIFITIWKIKKMVSLENDDYKEEKIISSEVAIVTDETIVRNILSHPKTKINEYGEFIDYDCKYDCKYLKNIALEDLYRFKEKHEMYFDWGI